jgi:hypothetical protein
VHLPTSKDNITGIMIVVPPALRPLFGVSYISNIQRAPHSLAVIGIEGACMKTIVLSAWVDIAGLVRLIVIICISCMLLTVLMLSN